MLASCGNSGSGNAAQDSTVAGPATDSSEATAETAPPNQLTDAEKAAGWQLLFDGTSLSGWHSFHQQQPGSAWKIQDGAIMLDTAQRKGYQIKGGGDLLTDATYGNFDLKLQWKIQPCGNSGVLFYVQDEPRYAESWHTGPEVQVLDNSCHSDAKIPKHRAGDLYDLISSSPETVNPAGQWNDVEIRSDNGHLQLFLNGVQVVETQLWTDEWKKLVAGSKFKAMPGFGTFKEGHLALQDHGFMVWYRNIRIRKL
ncbi:DUF1080 domain-containing protein [Compostibacter hankyongensis]|uniref:DUF1080 domain-containing protein n=2 Tax=Compostibacter hankyongensis TaxID=1007089 RepID=A0ABP8FIX3_9BACT